MFSFVISDCSEENHIVKLGKETKHQKDNNSKPFLPRAWSSQQAVAVYAHRHLLFSPGDVHNICVVKNPLGLSWTGQVVPMAAFPPELFVGWLLLHAAEHALGCCLWLLKAPQLWEEIPLLLAGWMTGQQGSKYEIHECDCIPLNPLQTTQWCQIGASQLLVMAGITEMKWTQRRGLVQLGMCCLKPLLSVQLSLKLMHQPCAC